MVSKIYGSYLGFLEFDGKRYWDARDVNAFKMDKAEERLPSDASYRPDLQELFRGNVETAQTKKEQLEELQRRDVKLRAASDKLRPKKK